MRERIDLVLGPCAGERWLRRLLVLLGALSLALAPTSLAWKFAGLVALAAAWRFAARPARGAGDRPASLRLYPDGTAALLEGAGERPVAPTGRAWITRPLTLLELADPDHGGAGWHAVCASRNAPRNYRRLLGLLRLRAFHPEERCLD
jgi:hypothetical protein